MTDKEYLVVILKTRYPVIFLKANTENCYLSTRLQEHLDSSCVFSDWNSDYIIIFLDFLNSALNSGKLENSI